MRSVLPLLLAALLVAAAPAPAAERAPRKAIAAAKQRAARHFGSERVVRVTFSKRSARKPRWALVTGERRGGRGRVWAAWVRRGAGGRWRVEVFRLERFRPPGVPCDLRPAFGEPDC